MSTASSAARLDGALTAANTGMPAMAAFWTSSNDALPETCSTVPFSGSIPARKAQPTTLSTALCLPTSSRRHSNSVVPSS